MKYGFIGCGNMGGALAEAASRSIGEGELLLADQDLEKARTLAARIGGKVASNEELAAECDFLILGVKPQMMGSLLKALSRHLEARREKPVLVSMAAGLSLDNLRGMLGVECPWIRIMPNTPALVGEGRILYAAPGVAPAAKAAFLKLFEGAGELLELEERLIDAGSALSGCGPAFVYLFIEALADGAVACGLARKDALALAAGTVYGSAKMVLETGAHPGVLKDAVCSPAGSTIAGVAALEQASFRGAAMAAVIKAYEKTRQLGKE